MSDDLEHLHPSRREAVSWPTEERVKLICKDVWLEYPRARKILATLEDLLSMPPSHRPTNALIVGQSGNGKTTIVERFYHLHKMYQVESGEARAPVVVMEMPARPNEKRFWIRLLTTLNIGHRETDPVPRLENQALRILSGLETRMLIIDEIHNMLHRDRTTNPQEFLTVLKGLSNALRLPIVCVGIRESIRALHTDSQLSSRFEAHPLPRWKLDREFVALLASFEKILPLAEPSGLTRAETATRIHSMSGRTIDGVCRLLRKLATNAVRNGRERITERDFDEISWAPLDDYRRQADAL